MAAFRAVAIAGVSSSVTYSFGPYRLDPAAHRLSRDGEPVALPDRYATILLLLVAKAGTIVPKEALLDAGWKDVAVGDNSLKLPCSHSCATGRHSPGRLRRTRNQVYSGNRSGHPSPRTVRCPPQGAARSCSGRTRIHAPPYCADTTRTDAMDTTERSTTFIIGGRYGHSRVPTVMSRNVLTLLVVALGAACGKGGTPTSPTSQAETLTWSVDGTSFVASANHRAAFRGGGWLSLNGSDCGPSSFLGLQIPDNASVGTYRIGDADLSVSWTPNRMAVLEWWLAPTIPPRIPGSSLSQGAGSLTISSLSQEWIAGTFAFEVFSPVNREAPSKNLQGRFELAFSAGWSRLCPR